jgi:cation diffusion facilitator CzcD-associated flavoprotein CzcO
VEHTSTDTVVIGAGPYGLSISAHLHAAGVGHRIFGEPLGAWRTMPRGMKLRSAVGASSLSDPSGLLTIEAYHAEHGRELSYPVALESFLEYGDWFIDRAGVAVERRLVARVARDDDAFTVRLEDGESIRAARIVVAAGADAFQWLPREFRGLPPSVASHSGDHRDLAEFAGKRLVVLGAGQSAIECAVLAHEGGADVRVLLRGAGVHWLTRSRRLHTAPLLASILYASTDVGPAGLSRVVSLPRLFRILPAAVRERATNRCVRPAAAAWLHDRSDGIAIMPRRSVREVTFDSRGLRIEFHQGSPIEADHLICATGYQPDLAHYAFLAPELLREIQQAKGFPVLRSGYESSVAGLHFVGWPSTWTYGPVMRFISGAAATSRSVALALRGRDRSAVAAAVPGGAGELRSVEG